MALSLATGTLDAVRRHARAAYPEECCGLLLGESRQGGARVTAVIPVANRHADPRHGFELAPAALAAALAGARRGGAAVVGVYHSHPDGSATPSARDAQEAWPCWSHLIVPVAGEACASPRSFRRSAAGAPFIEESLESW